MGRHGDFSTGPAISEWLGKAIARWIQAESKSASVIEIGAGSGMLSRAVLRQLGWWRRRNLRYVIVDISEPLIALQRETLCSYRQIVWCREMQEALAHCNGAALIFSNELLDAFPCRRLEWTGSFWSETQLVKAAEGWKEQSGSDPFISAVSYSALQNWPGVLKAGQRIELHETVQTWLQQWSSAWKKGKMLTIDYGDRFPEIYYRRPNGTLRAYFHHQRLEGNEVYSRAGHHDITADVNFTDFEAWQRELGWKVHPLRTQRDFLLQWTPEISSADDAAARYLAAEEGMGSAFKVSVAETL